MRNIFLLLGLVGFLCTASAQTFDCDSIGVRGPLTFDTTNSLNEVCPGQSFCVDFAVTNFDAVLGFQFTLTFDPTKVIYLSAEQNPIPLRGFINFGIDDTNNGQLEILWTDEIMLSQTIDDNTVLFTLCFVAVGEGLDDVNIFINKDLAPAYPSPGVAYQPSLMVACLSDSISLNDDEGIVFPLCCNELSINNLAQCTSQNNDISFSACGGQVPYVVNIINDQNGVEATNTINLDGDQLSFESLPDGTYTIEVTDASNQMVTETVSVMMTDPISYDLNVAEPSCHFRNDGAVNITNITGGDGTYSIRSSAGYYASQLPQYDFSDLGNGDYSFIIEDGLGCTEQIDVELNTSELEVIVDVDPATCSTFTDGFVTVTATGGVPFSGDTYLIDGVISQSFEASDPLNHPLFNQQDMLFSISVEDANGCITTEFFEIPLLFAPGDPCDDSDPDTENDMIQNDCTCAGTLIPGLQYIGDTDLFLPGNIVITLQNCLEGYSFPAGVFEDPQSGMQYPYPLLEDIHYQGLTALTFESSHTPYSIFEEGITPVTYIIEDENGDALFHTFNVEVVCEQNCNSMVYCPTCIDVLNGGCFSCGVNDLLDGFSSCNPEWNGNMVQSGQPNPLCNNEGTPQNMSWFSFVAGSESLEIIIDPTNCIEGANGTLGIEVGIYDDCQGSCLVGDMDCGQAVAKLLTPTNLVVGQTYYLFIDGCEGSSCEYEIQVNNTQNFSISQPTEIQFTSNDAACDIMGNEFCDACEVLTMPFHNGSAGYEDQGFYSSDLDLEFEWTVNPPINGQSEITASIANDGYIFPPILNSGEELYAICLLSVTGSCDSWSGIICTELYLRDCSDFDNDNDMFPFSEDCDDDNPEVNPAAEEVCDGIDNNCDGVIDEGFTETYYVDNDGDGFGDPNNVVVTCQPDSDLVLNNEDCNDNSNISFPGAMEICDGLDNNCDGEVDEGIPSEIYYADKDLDGFGDPQDIFEGCFKPFGYVDNADDCDDDNSNINPNSAEECDGIDNNCDGSIDEGLNPETYYVDFDMDGFGDPDNSIVSCDVPPGTTLDNTDCDDMNADIYPGAMEILGNDIDENCDGRDNTTSTEDNLEALISIYPNPTKGILFIEGVDFEKVQLVDKIGRTVLTAKDLKIDMSHLADGIYLIQFLDAYGIPIYISKVIKQ